MKSIGILLLLLSFSCKYPNHIKGGSRTESYVDEISGDTIKTKIDSNIMSNDTFFLKRKTNRLGVLNKVFIDPDKHSPHFETVFNIDVYDKDNIKNYAKKVVNNGHFFRHIKVDNLPTEWRPIVLFHNKYYLYDPSDDGYKHTIMISDSTLMIYFPDGYTPIALSSITKKSENLYIIQTNHYADIDSSCPLEVKIHILDKKSKLSVWEFDNGTPFKYELMVPRISMYNFRLIINEGVVMDDEFDFEKIDAEKLLN